MVVSRKPTSNLSGVQTLTLKSKRRSQPCESNVLSGCCRDAVSHSQMKSDSEIRAQWMALLSVSNVYNDRNGNDGAIFFLAFETLDLAMQEEGAFKAEELQMVYIDFHEN